MADSLGALTIKFLGDIAEFRTAQQQVLDLSKQTAANVNKAFDSVQSSIRARSPAWRRWLVHLRQGAV